MRTIEPQGIDEQVIAKRIRTTSLFSGFADAELKMLIKLTRLCRIVSGEILFRQSEACRAFYLLTHGCIRLSRKGETGREKTIAFIMPGQTFAEAAMFSGSGYPVNAVALENSDLIAFDCYRFTRYMQSHPEITWKILATLSQHLHRLVNQIETLTTHSAEQKVAALLLEYYDPEAKDGLVAGLPTNRVHIADMLGMKPETLCRTLGKFACSGWIIKDGPQLRILDEASLSKLLTSSLPNCSTPLSAPCFEPPN